MSGKPIRSKEAAARTGAGVRRAAQERKAIASQMADATEAREVATRACHTRPITPEIEQEALQMLADGRSMSEVTAHFGLSRAALLVYGNRNPDFNEQIMRAMSLGTVSIINDAMMTAKGEPGYTTGSIERDKLVADMAWRYAKTIGNRIFGDKLQVDQRQIVINYDRTDEDW